MRRNIKLEVHVFNIHPLRITEGWIVRYNNFREIDPKKLETEDDRWFMFTESLLQLYHEKSSITLDLGWYPDLSSDGNYIVLIVKNTDWDNPIQEFSSDDYTKVIDFIEFHLKEITSNWWK
ncbi:hypothetical protein [Bacillus safensis]|uniref:hypothetical protein n=1 Tax=Bacillus safensis TaxID=561879 RepID=UPI001BE9EA95|nr:hypothetical protein [Bacillus safensis]MBT2259869.1 hypothetical protein [Bacillus safensis]